MKQGGVLRNRMRLRAPGLPLALSLAAILLVGCGGSGGNRFVGPGGPPPREPTTEDREGRAEEILKGLEFLNQTDKRLVFVEETEDEDGDGTGNGNGDGTGNGNGDGTGTGMGTGNGNGDEEEAMRKVAISELARINAHHAYGWTHRRVELLDETGDISGFGVYVGVGGLGLEHNHKKIMGRLFQSVVPYPEGAFDVLRIDTDANQEFSAQELLASLDRIEDIDAVEESFEARKKALVRSLTSQYYSDDEAANRYPDQDEVHGDYIIHIDDIKDLTDDDFDDQKRFTYLREILNWAAENDLTGPDDFDPEDFTDPAAIIPVAGDGTTDKDLTDNFRYIEAVCADKGNYSSAATTDCPTDRPHFIDFSDDTEERDLRLIPDFSQRLLGSQAPGLIANERNIHLANLSSLPVEEEDEDLTDDLTELLALRAIDDLATPEEKIERARELLPDLITEATPQEPEDIDGIQSIINVRIRRLLEILEIALGIPRNPETDPSDTDGTLTLEEHNRRIADRIEVLFAELRFAPEDGPVHGVAFGSRIVPHVANAVLRIECADGDNEATEACLAAGDIRKSSDERIAKEIDLDKLFADYIKAIPGPTDEAVDAGQRGDGVVRAVDIFLLDAVVEGSGIAGGASRKTFLNENLDETLAAIEEFLERRNNPVMVVRSGYGGFQGEADSNSPDPDRVHRGPRTLAALPYRYETCTQANVDVDCRNFRGRMLTAAALNMHNNELHENSPRCGNLPNDWIPVIHGRHYCLTAPGDRLRINGVPDPDSDGGIDLTAGFRNGSNEKQPDGSDEDPDEYQVDLGAASFVAGSLAVLSERFRGQLSGRELALRLVNTANQDIFYDDDTLLTDKPRPTEEEMNNPDESVARNVERERRKAVEETYGAGLIDLEAASAVIGEEVVRIPSSSASRNKPASAAATYTATKVTTSPAFGDGLALALYEREIVTFDEWDAPFWRPLSWLVSTSTNRRSLLERREDASASGARFVPLEDGGLLAFTTYQDDKLFSDDRGSGRWAERYRDDDLAQEHKIELSVRQPVDDGFETELLFATGQIAELPLGLNAEQDFTHPYLGFAGEGVGAGGSMALGAGRVTALGFSGSQGEGEETYAAHGGLLEYSFAPSPSLKVGMQTGALIEEERALGLRSSGAFGEIGATSTVFAGVSVEGELDANWRFRAQAMGGRANLSAPSVGLVDDFSGVATSAFRLGIEGYGLLRESDEFSLFVSQPLRVESGSVALVVPVGRTRDGALLSERIEGVSLAPGGREIEVSARYEFNLTGDLALGLNAGIVREGGHIQAQAIEFYGLGDLHFHF